MFPMVVMMLFLLLLQTEAHPTDEGEGPGGQDGRHPAGATGESTQGHCQSQFINAKRGNIFSILGGD